jgi:chemotaxis protein CheD
VGRGEGTLSVLGLGSCVAIVLYDRQTRVGGLAHVLLPDPAFSSNPDQRWRFATTAIPDLLKEVERAGAIRTQVTARLVGGACMFQELIAKNGPHIGKRNVAAARTTLDEGGVRIVAEEVGGDFGRSVDFDLENGRVRVSSHGRDDVEI